MIFKPALIAKVLRGSKTQTRRPVKPGESECRYQPGKTYALQPGRGKEAVGRIRIVDVRQELLADITPKDAQREGFKTRDDFFAYWRDLYATGPLIDVPVWVITFELVREHEVREGKRHCRGCIARQALSPTEGEA